MTSDYIYPLPKATDEIVWAHRQTPDADAYFVANQKARTEDVVTSYRINGKAPELWHPDTGAIEPAAYRVQDNRTFVTLHLAPEESVFVVFRDGSQAPFRVLPEQDARELTSLSGAWKVTFPAGLGASSRIELPSLLSWTDSSQAGIKYFSGTATYSQDFNVEPQWLSSGAATRLDLGRVREIAEVTVNGKPVGGILWKPPFAADISSALKAGANHIEIRVTNLWPNRLIGDQQLGAEQYTFTDYQAYTKDSPLIESGLLGPVRLIAVTAAAR